MSVYTVDFLPFKSPCNMQIRLHKYGKTAVTVPCGCIFTPTMLCKLLKSRWYMWGAVLKATATSDLKKAKTHESTLVNPPANQPSAGHHVDLLLQLSSPGAIWSSMVIHIHLRAKSMGCVQALQG
ncbi:hypothetical protein GDO78_010684 [Eleutherodactylus coqui]|uniref:Uncharacterized protein n=1 Tax=Eleutherodactylus coqui TaxID=57060 RepID=A0A8J6F4W7_ELECQ|nr:hypothetical protein GDO78_010684 [Eleutherodactylus coqui]